MAECKKQFRDYHSELASQQSTLRDITHSANYMGQGRRTLHHRHRKTASTAASIARKSEAIDGNIQKIIHDRQITPGEIPNIRSLPDLLDTGAPHSDCPTSNDASGLRCQLMEAQKYERRRNARFLYARPIRLFRLMRLLFLLLVQDPPLGPLMSHRCELSSLVANRSPPNEISVIPTNVGEIR